MTTSKKTAKKARNISREPLQKHVRNARAQLSRGGLYTMAVEMEEL